jgi:hypothetical protein
MVVIVVLFCRRRKKFWKIIKSFKSLSEIVRYLDECFAFVLVVIVLVLCSIALLIKFSHFKIEKFLGEFSHKH